MPEGTSGVVERRPTPTPDWNKLSPQAALPTILRRWRLIALVVATVMALAALTLSVMLPRYTSEMTLLFETRRNLMETDFETVMEGRPQNNSTIVGEIQVIRSRDLAMKVIDELYLDTDPEFTGAEPLDGDVVGAAWFALKNAPVLKNVPLLRNLFSVDELNEEQLIDTYLEGLRVSQIADSPAVLVSYTSSDAEKSAEILNAIERTFMGSGLEDRLRNAKWVSDWLVERIQEMREKVEQAERSVAAYREKHGLVAGERTPLINERISKLSIELTDAVAARQIAEARQKQAKRVLQRPDSASAFSRVIDSRLVDELRQRQVELQQRVAELDQTLGSRHPRMIQLQAERQKLDTELRLEIARLADTFEYEANVALAREKGLAQQLEAAKNELGSVDRASVGFRSLEREAESNRLMLESFMNLVPQISAQSDVQALLPTTRIISRASVPAARSFPQTIPFLAISLLAAVGLGVLLALFADYLGNRTFVSAEEVEATIRLPVMALVPRVPGSRRDDISERVLDFGHPVFAEAISALFTRMVMTHRTDKDILSKKTEIKCVAFTSCEPSEGKSTISLALARQQARSGRRVILVDADFAMSRLAVFAGAPADSPGLAEVLMGKAAIEDVVRQDAKSPLNIILPGRTTVDHSGLATSTSIEKVIVGLREKFDLVVIDTQPVMATAHAYPFASAADVSLMVVRWRRTQRREVVYALHQLRQLGCNVNAVVLSMVDFNKSRRYGYGDSHYYSGRASQYYTKRTAGS